MSHVLWAVDQEIPWGWILGGIGLLLGLIFLFVFFSFVQLWIQCLVTGANVSIWKMVGMRLAKVDYAMVVRQKIALVQAGVNVRTDDLSAHYLAKGNVQRVANAV